MKTFQFTNAYSTARFVAVYSQQSEGNSIFNFNGIAADISIDVYLITTR